MRAREILDENYDKSLESDLTNLLTGAAAAGAQQIKTGDLVNQLNNMGYSVNANSIMSLLSQSPMIMNATPTMVQLATQETKGNTAAAAGQDTAARVSDLAAKATKIG